MITAVIPTYKGRARLERHLASVIEALTASGEAWEVLVVDDGGGGLGPLPAGVRLIGLPENHGYGPAVNAGVAEARGACLLVLNDDVRLERETVAVLHRQLRDDDVFAVVPRIASPLAACGDEGGKAGVLRAGLLELVEAPAERVHPTLYPVGCCYLCSREAFETLGGYDDLFAPFFWEDVDLGYRAWRRGLRILHVPQAVCHHEGSMTLREAHGHEERERIEFRNRVLFHLRNLQGATQRAGSLGALAAHALFDGRAPRRAGLGEALSRFAPVGPRPLTGLSDAEILARVAGA